MFSDEEFEAIARELENPVLQGWENLIKCGSVNIYRRYREDSGLYEYKVAGIMDGIDPRLCAKVYTDIQYRGEWDSYVKVLKEISEGSKEGVYWEANFPFPLSNRDYTFIRAVKEVDIDGKRYWSILSRSEHFSSIPEKKGVVRVDDFIQSLAITSDGNDGTKAFMYYYDDPKGMIPTWIINWAAKSGIPSFLDIMKEACIGYEDFVKRQERSRQL